MAMVARPGIRLALCGLLAAFALSAPAAASWPPGGMLISSPGGVRGVVDARIMELPVGDLAVLGVGLSYDAFYFNLQRVSRDGVIAAGWPAGGTWFSGVLSGYPLPEQSIVVDDASRTWHSWVPWGNPSRMALQSIAADASRAPAAAVEAYDLGSPLGLVVHAAPAPDGDVFVTCGSARLKRITTTGAPASGWTSTGVTLPGYAYDDNAILADGSGGVVVFMREPPIATRIDGNGVLHTGWPATGLVLSSVATPSFTFDSYLLPSGPDHMLAVWSPDEEPGTRRLLMQRFGLDGTLDPAWPADGLVVASDTLYACRALADGSGGAYIVRESHGQPVATHITAAGGTLGGTDVEFVDAGARYLPIFQNGLNHFFMNPEAMIADVTPDGGLLVGWNDARLAPAVSFRLRWLTPSLTPAPGKPDTGLVYFPGSPTPYDGSMMALHADGGDAAFVAWGDNKYNGPGADYGDLWMTRVQAPAPVSVGPSGPRALALSAPRPNPARSAVALDLTLPDDFPARVELFDVAGRVVRSKSVQGAGMHIVFFADVGSLPSGLYLARVTTRTESRSVRLVLTH